MVSKVVPGIRAILAVTVLAALTLAPTAAAKTYEPLTQYRVTGKKIDTDALARAGFDLHEGRSKDGGITIVTTARKADRLRQKGFKLQGKSQSAARSIAADALPAPTHGYDVFRPWSLTPAPCPGGTCDGGRPNVPLKTLWENLASANPDVVKRRVIGHAVSGQEILAYKVTADPGDADGSKPSVLYNATQHAREWISAEVEYRLFSYVLAHKADSATDIPDLLSGTEMWFVPVVNPDGYDYTFVNPDTRLWRKNLRDNDNDGQITGEDGVDTNRNWPTNWNYDLEGAASDRTDETYHGSAPGSEPEVQGLRSLMTDIKPKFHIDYHSYAQLILYPFGFQVETPADDYPIFRALAGDDRDPAVEGFDPDVSGELYTTNGDITDDSLTTNKTLPFTVELSGGSGPNVGGTDGSDPGGAYTPAGFVFQDSEADIDAEFQKNLPFALDLARSAADPEHPDSHLGNTPADIDPTTFGTSFGNPQTVEADARRSLGPITVKWTTDREGDGVHSAPTAEYKGGKRFGKPGVYYHHVRGQVTGTRTGDTVRVWFEAPGGERSRSFSYTVKRDSGRPVLILAAEDYTGNSAQPSDAYDTANGPKYLSAYTNALKANGIGYDVYDVDAQGRDAPSALGVLSHYRAVVWYTGDDLYVREPGQPGGTGASKLADDEVLAARSYLNDGGKLLTTGKLPLEGAVEELLYNPIGAPPGPFCASNTTQGQGSADDPPNQVENCVAVSNDFLQYYLGAYLPIGAAADKDEAAALPLQEAGSPFGSLAFRLNGPGSADNQDNTYSWLTTSSILPASTYPRFASKQAIKLARPPAFDPPTGSNYVFAKSRDESWQRLRKTIDLTNLTPGQAADLQFKLSYDTEPDYDFVAVEAHTVDGTPDDDWTTLPDENGHTSDDVGQSCDIDWNTIHPFLDHYQTNPTQDEDNPDCTNTGTTGSWNAATGNSGGFKPWRIDLSDYAGKTVEISVSYIQDFGTAGLGVFLDDAQVTENGTVTDTTSFESDLGGYSAGPPPPGTDEQATWARTPTVGYLDGPGVATADTLLWGFGLEGVRGAPARAALLRDGLRYLGVRGSSPVPTPGGGGPKPKPRPVVISRKGLKADSKGRVGVRIRCRGTGACKGRLTIRSLKRRSLGSRAFAIAAGKTKTVTVKLNRRALRALAKGRHRLRVSLQVKGKDSAGAAIDFKRRVTISRSKALARKQGKKHRTPSSHRRSFKPF
jgi:zinc carboxypeptidase/immune inhibitor InhA-like protein